MMDNKEDLFAIYERHISILTQWGIHHMGTIQGAIHLLDLEFKGETELSDVERGNLIRIIDETNEKYLEIIRDLVNERKQYFGQLDDETDA